MNELVNEVSKYYSAFCLDVCGQSNNCVWNKTVSNTICFMHVVLAYSLLVQF